MNKISDLEHVKKELPCGGVVYVLDNGAVINSEGEAMIQALHSRSVGGFEDNMRILGERGPENFMKNFYVGYGHKSIGDCGSITIFIENVSMLVAKAIQDSKLYSGQESSTRYIDFSEQKFINPLKNKKGEDILESLREFYLFALNPTAEMLKELYPICEGEKKGVYEKAIMARAFDITRGFLPAGTSTNLAWHSNLRQISDKLLFLRNHPLEEVREIGNLIEEAVLEFHPNSFTSKRYDKTEEYQKEIAKYYYFHNPNISDKIQISSQVNEGELERYTSLLNNRPEKTELPKFLSHMGTVQTEFKLDFGSFRDIQRHRAIDQRMPLLTDELGFNSWYLENLPEKIRKRAVEFLDELREKVKNLNCSKEVKQYYLPMGYNISNYITGDIPSMLYMVELRATRFVHPTLREIAVQIGNYMKNEINIRVYLDSEPDRFDVKRGEHDIVLK